MKDLFFWSRISFISQSVEYHIIICLRYYDMAATRKGMEKGLLKRLLWLVL